MNDHQRDAYVSAAMALQGYAFSDERIRQITLQFERIESIASTILDVELPADIESGSVFRP